MGPEDKARWCLTDTLSVPVTVLQVVETEGRAYVSSSTGEKWIRLDELELEGSES